MRSWSRGLVVLLVLVMGPGAEAQDWMVEQSNGDIPASAWEPVPLQKEIWITQDVGTEPFIFRAYYDDLPGDPAAPINKIFTTLSSGEIHLQVGQPGTGNEGATNLAAIAIDSENITSVIEGICITGDFLAQEAMTVDHVTGPIQVGGALRRAMEVGSTVSQPISIGDGLAAEVTAEFQGDEAEFSEQQTPDDVSVAPLRTPFSQKGPEEEEEEYDWGPSSHQRSFIERSAAMPRHQ